MKVEEWDRAAPGWERQRERTQVFAGPVSRRMVELLRPQASWTVLEVAAGPGDTGFLAAGSVERLISTDYSPRMVEAARRRAAELDLQNVELAVMDAQRLELPDVAVDGILCRWGYMLVDDPAAALAEARRVLRPGGRLVFAIWAEAERNPWATILGRILLERGHVEPPEPGAPGMFTLADRELLAGLVRGAGFGDLSAEDVELTAPYRDVDDFLGVQLDMAAQTGVIVRALPTEEYEEVRAELARRFERFRSGEGLLLPGVSRIVTAS